MFNVKIFSPPRFSLLMAILFGLLCFTPGTLHAQQTWDLQGDPETSLIHDGSDGESEQNSSEQDSLGLSGEQTKQENVIGFLDRIINFLTGVVGSLSLLALIAGGFMMVVGSARNNEESLSRAKEIIKYAMIGLALVFCSYLIVRFIQVILYA